MFYSNKIENLNMWAIKSLLYLIPLLPFFYSTSLVFPYITGKNFAFRIMVEFAAVLWTGLIFTNNKYRPDRSIITYSLLIFVFIVGLADLLGVNPYNSFWSNYERMEGYITILHLLLYFLILNSVMRTRRDWKIFFNMFIAGSVLVSLYAFLIPLPIEPTHYSRYVIEYGTRLHSTIGNPPFLASYMLFSIFIGLILIFNTRKPFLKLVYLSVILLNSVVIYMTGSRGAILGWVSGIIIGLFFLLNGKKVFSRMLYIVFVIFIISILSVVFVTLHYSDFMENKSNSAHFEARLSAPSKMNIYRFVNMFSDFSVKSRFRGWEMALNGFKERPILGWGQGNFVGVYTANPIPFDRNHVWMDRAHNIVFDWLISAGFLGLFSYLAVFAAAFYFIRSAFYNEKISRAEALVIVTALIVYFIQNLFTFDTINTYLIFFALLAYTNNLQYFEEAPAETPGADLDVEKIGVRCVYAFSVSLLIFSAACYYLNYKPIKQNQEAVKLTVMRDSPLSTISEDFEYLLSFNTFGNSDVRERMIRLSNHLLKNRLFREEGALEFIQATAEELWRGLAVNHYNLEYYSDVINFYTEIAQYEPSYVKLTEKLVNECLRLNPQFQWTHMAMADVYKLKRDYKGAFEIIGKIAENDPEDDLKQIKMAMAAILISREDIVIDKLDTVKRIRTVSDKDIATGKKPLFNFIELRAIAENYLLVNDLQRALHYYTEITRIPELYIGEVYELKMAEVHYKMSEIYMSQGEEEKAAEEAEKAMKFGRNAGSM
jgi:O-antigen ligase/tetratricopeptide (TPR) repeat protein